MNRTNEVDDVAAAREFIDLAQTYINGYQHLTVADLIAIAQVHATLALAAKESGL
ncbi:hypothetical protein RCF19_33785 [Rhodococcus qingshengii]